MLAQLGNPDMRTAIGHALAWPERIDTAVAPLDLAALGRLDFEPPDLAAFPCLALAFRALRDGPAASTVLNAANEVAGEGFLPGRGGFLGIPDVLAHAMDHHAGDTAASLDDLLALDAEARRTASSRLARS